MKISQSVLQRSRLGQLLIDNKLITAEQLEEATRLQQSVGKRLGEILVEQGLVAEKQINRVLRKQKMLRLLAVVATILVAPFPMARAGDLAPARDLYTATQQDLITSFEAQANPAHAGLPQGLLQRDIAAGSQGRLHGVEFVKIFSTFMHNGGGQCEIQRGLRTTFEVKHLRAEQRFDHTQPRRQQIACHHAGMQTIHRYCSARQTARQREGM